MFVYQMTAYTEVSQANKMYTFLIHCIGLLTRQHNLIKLMPNYFNYLS